MNTFLAHIWNKLRTSYWFVPGILLIGAAVLAYGSLAIDEAVDSKWSSYHHSIDGIRSLVSTAAASVLTLAGITFSATLVALTLASSQFGSRILRNFIRSLPNQFTLGLLLGNFVFCLIVLRGMKGDGPVTHVAALTTFTITILSLATFIYFVHHIAVSLQADHIVQQVYGELDENLEKHFPDKRPQEREEQVAGSEKETWKEIDEETIIRSKKAGYIQVINFEGLVEAVRNLDSRCRTLHRAGQFVHPGTPLLALSRDDAEVSSEDAEKLLDHVIVGALRTGEQDFEFCLRQLVEIALRALSPGINDPFTAMNCIDYLGAALAKVAGRRLPERTYADQDDVSRVRSSPNTFRDLLDAAFHQIRQASPDKPDVSIRILEALALVGSASTVDLHREAILTHTNETADGALRANPSPTDSAALNAARDAVVNNCQAA